MKKAKYERPSLEVIYYPAKPLMQETSGYEVDSFNPEFE